MNYSNKESKGRKINVWLPLLFAVTSAFSILVGFQIRGATAPVQVAKGQLPNRVKTGKLEEMLRFIEAKYVDEVDREALVDAAMESILKQLDPHSAYISSDQLQGVNESLEGSFEGVGIQFFLLNDTILVVSPVAGGPSDKVGILAGDKIVEIEDSTVAGIGITDRDVIAKLRGEKGSKVRVGIQRGRKQEVIPFTIVRDEIPDYSVDSGYMLDEKTGYIKISRFSGTTYEEFMRKLEALNEEGLENLVIDLRRNPGGYLTAATKIVDQLLPQKNMIVFTKGRTQRINEYESSGRNFYDVNNVAVLIDEGSASASEILAGAIQDLDRGTIIGRRSFGKGLVQEQYNLSDGSALRLTVARYYTPSGRCIQKPYDGATFKDLLVADSLGADSTKFLTVNGREVFGGGGISPDIIVPFDSIVNNKYFIRSFQYINSFVYEYQDENRSTFAPYETFDQYDRKFVVSDEIMAAFTNYVSNEGVELDDKEFAESKARIAKRIKALFARQLFDEDSLYKIINQDDPFILEALQEVNSAKDKR